MSRADDVFLHAAALAFHALISRWWLRCGRPTAYGAGLVRVSTVLRATYGALVAAASIAVLSVGYVADALASVVLLGVGREVRRRLL